MKRWPRTGRWLRRIALSFVAAIALAFLLPTPGRFAPPALLDAGPRANDVDLKRFPPNAEKVELALASGEKLRGVFTPSDPGAPVVLQLVESTGRVSSYDDLPRELAELGFASLIVDYRGIGASDGSRSVTHLAEDAEAMWHEALRRVDGREDLVVLRATSIGTLAACALLERGARPGAIELVDPIRAESAVSSFAANRYGAPVGWLATLLFRPILELDVASVLERTSAPLEIISPKDDECIRKEEQAELRARVESRGGKWLVCENGHEGTAWDAHAVLEDELEFLRRAFPSWPDEFARLDRAMLALDDDAANWLVRDDRARFRFAHLLVDAPRLDANAVAAIVRLDWSDERAQKFAFEEESWGRTYPPHASFEHWLAQLDERDPAGAPPELFVTVYVRHLEQNRPGVYPPDPELDSISDLIEVQKELERELAGRVQRIDLFPPTHGGSAAMLRFDGLWRDLRERRGLSTVDARRLVLRMLLKGAGLPDRVVVDASGVHLEAKECGEWKRVELDWPEPDAPQSTSSAKPTASSR